MDFIRFNDPSSPALMAYASAINSEAQLADVPPCALAAIVARETGGRNIFQEGMQRGPGCGVGLTQITSGVDWSNPADPTYQGYHLLKPADNIYVCAAFFLKGLIAAAHRLAINNPTGFARSCRDQIIFAMAVGYNGGWGMVQTAVANGVDADGDTTDGYGTWVYAKYLELLSASHRNAPKG